MSFSLKNLVIVAAVGLFASGAHAEKVRVELNIKKLTANFSASGKGGEYTISGAQVECRMKIKSDDVSQEADCSQSAAVSEGAKLVVKKANAKQIEVVMTSADADGKVSKDTIRGKFVTSGTQDGLNVSKYKMDLNDLRKKFAMSVTDRNEGVSMKVSIKFQGDGEILVIDDGAEVRLQFPAIILVLEGSAN
ncbi:MAG: hypothetical protein K2X47_05325 [Bdellovibrionales bacterium]|nr:hypothetical protein [Bdellovibrionales bacterium]